jgi:hypothetical protein
MRLMILLQLQYSFIGKIVLNKKKEDIDENNSE